MGVALTVDDGWVVSAAGSAIGICLDCGLRSRSRHGRSSRDLQDLPVQCKPVTVKLRLSRWRCSYRKCERQTFTDRLPMIAAPYARQTTTFAEIVGMLGHSTRELPGERLMQRLGKPVNDDTILRQLLIATPRSGWSVSMTGVGGGASSRSLRSSTVTSRARSMSFFLGIILPRCDRNTAY